MSGATISIFTGNVYSKVDEHVFNYMKSVNLNQQFQFQFKPIFQTLQLYEIS